ncbi:MAG: ABC transporter permease [Acidimicrobiales bacterium]
MPDTLALDPAFGAVPAAAAPIELAANKRIGLVGILSATWLIGITAAAILAPVLPIADPKKPYLELKNGIEIAGPGAPGGHLLGGDGAAHDLLARVIWGARASLLIGFCSVIIGLLIGGALGLVAGYFRGKIDTVLSAAFDTLLAIPAIVMALALVAVLAPNDPLHPVTDGRRLSVLIGALGLVSIPVLARITRASTLAWAQREFVLASRAIGARNGRIIRREVLPNVLPAMLSIALLGVAVVIVGEAGLSLLNVGLIDTPSWGTMLVQGYTDIRRSPWSTVVPSGAIFLTVLALNYLGDVVRARFDVREAGL